MTVGPHFRTDVAIWRSIMDGPGFRRMTIRDMRVNDIHNPPQLGIRLSKEDADRGAFRGLSGFRDDIPPVTLINSVVREGNIVQVCGPVADTRDNKSVTVNGRAARSICDSYAEWEVTLDASPDRSVTLTASAVDVNGLAEKTPHVLHVD